MKNLWFGTNNCKSIPIGMIKIVKMLETSVCLIYRCWKENDLTDHLLLIFANNCICKCVCYIRARNYQRTIHLITSSNISTTKLLSKTKDS